MNGALELMMVSLKLLSKLKTEELTTILPALPNLDFSISEQKSSILRYRSGHSSTSAMNVLVTANTQITEPGRVLKVLISNVLMG